MEIKMNKISVLIPIYNVEKYLSQCLESVLQQSLYAIEIICINDGSTDSSLKILQKYAVKDQRIKIINKKNTGYGHSMNIGLKEATGEYIGIVESDDFAEENMFQVLYKKAVMNNADIVKSNYFAQKGDEQYFMEPLKGESYGIVYAPNQSKTMLYSKTPCIWTGIYKRNFLLKNNIWFNETPGASYQDVSFYLKTMICAKRIYLLKEAYLHYRTDNVTSSVRSKEKVKCIFDEFAEIKQFLKNQIDFKRLNINIIPTKVIRYMENYRRVDDKYKMLFLSYAADDFCKDDEEGLLQVAEINITDWSFVQKLVHHREQVFFEAYSKIQQQRLCLKGFFVELQKFPKLYIYGAGKVGVFVAEYLLQKNIKIESFLVSILKGNPANIKGIKVQTAEMIKSDKQKSLILVSVKDIDQYDLICALKNQGFEHLVSMNLELRNAMM
jgi:glycosyltransferase involved in cell wall biosynthesis